MNLNKSVQIAEDVKKSSGCDSITAINFTWSVFELVDTIGGVPVLQWENGDTFSSPAYGLEMVTVTAKTARRLRNMSQGLPI